MSIMRKKINIILICAALSLVFASGAFASSSSTQVTCDGTVKAVYPGAHDKHRPDKSVFIQNQEPSIPVYVGPAATITIHNGGILLHGLNDCNKSAATRTASRPFRFLCGDRASRRAAPADHQRARKKIVHY